MHFSNREGDTGYANNFERIMLNILETRYVAFPVNSRLRAIS